MHTTTCQLIRRCLTLTACLYPCGSRFLAPLLPSCTTYHRVVKPFTCCNARASGLTPLLPGFPPLPNSLRLSLTVTSMDPTMRFQSAPPHTRQCMRRINTFAHMIEGLVLSLGSQHRCRCTPGSCAPLYAFTCVDPRLSSAAHAHEMYCTLTPEP